MLTQAFGEAEAQKLTKTGGESIWGAQTTVYNLDEPGGPWPNAAKAFGEEEARGLQATLRSCYEKRTQVLIALREDLSRTPPSTTSDN